MAFAVIILILCGLIYVIFRGEHLIMFSWFERIGIGNQITELRNSMGHIKLGDWIIYNIPAGLWLFSYLVIIDSVWHDDSNLIYRFFIIVLPIMSILSEVLQLFKIIPGTFDLRDVLCYVVSLLLFLTVKKI